MSQPEPGPVQVLDVTEEGSYTLNETALATLLLEEGVADCPVAIVSVAGAYRGGKSFLLDFFLRYLRAHEENRENDTWLGSDKKPLKGFHWRGGSQRDTTGLVMWSQPYRVVLPSGEPVLVLLMDTQGAFDWSSSVRDCSTVFALSTLLSSVQIYNLSRDVRADDLHYLQLFTEYARLASEGEEEAPFQTLQFLVRDWSYPYDHPYGAEGGRQLLNQRLQSAGEIEEVSELWKKVQTSFHQVNCFLMPHPGLRALQQDFCGRLPDLSEEFKQGLLELAPAVLGSQTLRPKTIRGNMMTGRDLFHYFKCYLEVFNSAETPAPMTIVQATATAGLLAGAEAARAHYRRAMDALCGAGAGSASHTRSAIRMAHAQACDGALAIIREARIMADADQICKLIEELQVELNGVLASYELMNQAKINKGMAEAHATYEERLKICAELEKMCLHPLDLERLHQDAAKAALARFNATRAQEEDEEEENEALKELIEWIEERYEEIMSWNEENNSAALSGALDLYRSRTEKLTDQPCVAPGWLQRLLEEAHTLAKKYFSEKRSRPTQHEDSYETELDESIVSNNRRLRELNESFNQAAVRAAGAIFEEEMEAANDDSLCLHPRELSEIDEAARAAAMDEFNRRRTLQAPEGDDDAYKDQIEMELGARHSRYREKNDVKNRRAIVTAIEHYNSEMERNLQWSYFDIVTNLRNISIFEETHQRIAEETRQTFRRFRRPSLADRRYGADTFKESLEQQIEERKNCYSNMALGSTVSRLIAGAVTIAAAAVGAAGAGTAGIAELGPLLLWWAFRRG